MTTPATTLADTPATPRTPRPARATFSTEDFRLLREAVVSYLQRPEVQDGPNSIKFSNLYHRLGRTG